MYDDLPLQILDSVRRLHDGNAYFFCSLECAGEFARQPERFAAD